MKYAVTIPVRTQSELNMREMWAVRHKRQKKQKEIVHLLWPIALRTALKPKKVLAITFVRLAPKSLDPGNLSSCFKSLQDQAAIELGLAKPDKNGKMRPLDSATDGVAWAYKQEQAKDYAVRIEITTG